MNDSSVIKTILKQVAVMATIRLPPPEPFHFQIPNGGQNGDAVSSNFNLHRHGSER